MKNPLTMASLFRGTILLGALALGTLGAGCSSEPPHPQLTLTSADHGRPFTQQFSSAYISRNPDGESDLVLLDRAAEQAMGGAPVDSPVRQVLHLRVLWNPNHDQKAEHSSGSNATIRWYVMGNTPQSSSDILEYSGTAFVLVEDTDNGTDLTIRSATLKPVACRGELQDPVGVCSLAGAIHATSNRQRVRDALNCVRTVVSTNDALPKTPSITAKPENPSSLAR